MASLFESIERAIEPNRRRCDPPDGIRSEKNFDSRDDGTSTMGNGELSKKHRDTASEDCAKGEDGMDAAAITTSQTSPGSLGSGGDQTRRDDCSTPKEWNESDSLVMLMVRQDPQKSSLCMLPLFSVLPLEESDLAFCSLLLYSVGA